MSGRAFFTGAAGLALLLGGLTQTDCEWVRVDGRADLSAAPAALLLVDDSFERDTLDNTDLGWAWTQDGCTLGLVTQDGGIPLDNDGTILPGGGVREDRWLKVTSPNDGGCTVSVGNRAPIPEPQELRTAVVRFDHTLANDNGCNFSVRLDGQPVYDGKARNRAGAGLTGAFRAVSVVNLPKGLARGMALEFVFPQETSADPCLWRLSNVRVMALREGGVWP